MSENTTAEVLQPKDNSRVLLVDDEPSLVELFKMVISMDLPDICVDTASNGIEAIESFTMHHHGVLVMDIHMPLMDGHTAFREIQKMCDVKGWQMPAVIFCSGYAPPQTLDAILAESTEHCLLSKPIMPNEVVEAIKQRL